MARKAGPGRPPGSTSTYTMSEAALAQRSRAASLSKPASRARKKSARPAADRRLPDTWETGDRDEAFRLTRALCLKSTQLVAKRLAVEEEAHERLVKALANPLNDLESIKGLVRALESVARLGELVGVMAMAHDRVGLPRRTQMQVDAANLPPVLVFAPAQMDAWDEREGTHAPVADGGDHAYGHPQH